MYIKSLRKFFSLRILQKHEMLEFKTLLIEFILKFHKEGFQNTEKKNIILEILKIISEYSTMELKTIEE